MIHVSFALKMICSLANPIRQTRQKPFCDFRASIVPNCPYYLRPRWCILLEKAVIGDSKMVATMEQITIGNAYYIKLGRGGEFEKSSIQEDKVRFGWDSWPVEEINQINWVALKEKFQHEYKNKGAATMDTNALKTIVESTLDDIWITFHASQLWWCRVEEPSVFKDDISRYRKVAGHWHNHDIHGHPLIINQIPGSISKIQRFQGTVCRVKEVDNLRRLLNDQPSEAFKAISKAKEALSREVEIGLTGLHWKDFETLVDLIFRSAGWRRSSVLGETMKDVDIELEEPITRVLYQVQVKSAATLEEFEKSAHNFSPGSFGKLYFVVHSPAEKLANYQGVLDENVELILPGRLAQMVVEFGLTDWLLKKIR
jgi:hypothetical protein